MYNALHHTHSGLRWIVLLLIVFAVFNAFSKWRFGKAYSRMDKMLNLFAMVFFHLQFAVGLILYFVSPKVLFGNGMMENPFRFYTVEHFFMMTAAMIVITIGRKRAEKAERDAAQHRKLFIWYTVALLLILAAIPWPFRTELGGSWF
ncbi:MAG: cytochrome B [Bacteroidota bacterium]